MSGRFFLDTNIFVYTFDEAAPRKRARARSLVQTALESGSGITSYQVVQEFLNVATRKFTIPLRAGDCALYLERVLDPLCEVHSSPGLYRQAVEIQERWQLSFYDSLIVSAALSACCTLLYSEDLQDGQRIREITIANPFS